MKRCMSYFLALVVICFEVGGAGAKAFWPFDGSNNFEIVESQEYPDYDAVLTLYRHKKTGAKVCHWKNHDVNRNFEISFKTPVFDDTGVNHVLEHCVCSGSKKYRDNNLLFKVINQTSNTFMNAFTAEDKTSYVASCLSDKQLLGFLDMFMDGAFNPLVMEDEMIFERESHRFQQKSEDEGITETGTVYNEMSQRFANINYVSILNCLKSLYPDSSYVYVPGGTPEGIRELTYEHLRETWENYYHPSNMLVALYGDLNADEFLSFMDKNYLSKYDKKEIDAGLKETDLEWKPTVKEYEFPADQNQETLNGSIKIVAYSIDNAKEISNDEILALEEVFENQSSYFNKRMEKELPSAVSCASFMWYGNKKIFYFYASGIEDEDLGKFENIVYESIKDAVENGIPDDIIKSFDRSAISYLCKKQLEKKGMRTGFGTVISNVLSSMWAKGENIFDGFKGDSPKNIDNDVLTGALKKAILGNNHKAVVITSPKKNLLEENRNKRRQELQDMKSKMSEEEQQRLIERTNKFENWLKEPSSSDAINKLQLMKVDDLSIDIPENKAVREFTRGVDFISIPSDDEFLYTGNVIFDVSDMSGEEYNFARLLVNLIGEVNTTKHDKHDLSNIIDRQIFMPSVRPAIFSKDGFSHMGILCNWTGKDENYLNDLEIIRESIIDIDFNDYDDIKAALSRIKKMFKSNLEDNPYSEMMRRGKYFAQNSDKQLEKSFDIEFYKFLEKADQEMKDNPETFANKLKEISKLAFNKKGVILGVEGREEFIQNSKENWLLFADKFYEPNVITEFEEEKSESKIEVKQREALNIGSTVQFNGIVSYFGNMDLINPGSLMVLSNLVNDKYLVPNVRHKLGAYFCDLSCDNKYMMLVSGRDPGVSETFDVFDKVPEFVRNMEISQEELNQYIINVYFNEIYSNINYYSLNMMFDVLDGVTRDEKIELLSEIKSTKVSDLKTFADILEKLLKSGYRFTVGSGSVIEQNKERFDKVLEIKP